MRCFWFVLGSVLLLFSCNKEATFNKGSFGYDVNFISKYQDPIILSNSKAKILLSSLYQGRVLTSTSNGFEGKSYGWINYDLISSQKLNEGGNGFGGEDRFWLAPIGSKYSLYYNGNSINNKNWYVPKSIDIEPYTVINKTQNSVTFSKLINIKNNIGTTFTVELDREVNLFSIEAIEKSLSIDLPNEINAVGFQSINTIKNLGKDWKIEEGIIAPWVLGMFPGDSSSITIFPFKKSKEYSMKIKQYLNPLSNERLKVVDNVVCYKTDGGFRSKIGLTKENALPVFGNYSAAKNVLTIITYSLNSNEEYLSCNESEESEMFGGDVINSYNNSKSKEAFTFYELESAAPGLLLNNGEKNIHIHNTYHFEGSFNSLDAISLKLLGISLQKVKF